jgi:hypothetical protein
MQECERGAMIKRLVSAPRKKTKKASLPVRTKNKKARRVALRAASNRAGGEKESILAAEQIFLMYDGAEAKHAET